MGKFLLFFDAMGLSSGNALPELTDFAREQMAVQARLYRILALIGAINAAVGAWYYLRIAAVMYLREAIEPLPRPRPAPVLGTIGVCAVLTLWLGVYPDPLLKAMTSTVPHRAPEGRLAMPAVPDRDLAGR